MDERRPEAIVNGDTLLHAGRLFLAVAIAFFGLQYLLYARFVGGLMPMPQWIPGNRLVAYLTGAFLIAVGTSMAIHWKTYLSASLLGVSFLLAVLFLHGMRASAVLADGIMRTRALEALALSGAALVLAGALPNGSPGRERWRALMGPLTRLGRFFFGISLTVFGIQHFMYAPFIVTLIPSWIPGHLFWVYFTGLGMIVAGACILVEMFTRAASLSLAAMFFLWVLVLHAPRVAAALRNGDEWSSAFVALAMGGAALIQAGACQTPGFSFDRRLRERDTTYSLTKREVANADSASAKDAPSRRPKVTPA